MITTVDKSDEVWCVLDWDDPTKLWCEDGERRPAVSSDFIFQRGKYAGSKVSEVDNTPYMKWMQETCADDLTVKIAIDIRLKELD